MRAVAAVVAALTIVLVSPALAAHHRHEHARPARVLRVGAYKGIRGQYNSIQAAVNASKPGDWILVAPGDYHEQGVPGADEPAGVLIRTPWIHLRGMNRNRVIVDGTKPGAPACSGRAQDQLFTKDGRDGVEPVQGDGGYVQ